MQRHCANAGAAESPGSGAWPGTPATSTSWSPQASYVTGAIVAADGGRTAI
jgi:hypothetical protein